MAGADVIGTAICIALLVIVAYVVAGSIITTTGVVINAQNDMTVSQQEQMETSITIADYHCGYETWNATYGDLWRINFTVLNDGNQVIKYINKTDVMVIRGSNPPIYYDNGVNTKAAAFGATTWYYDGYFDKDVDRTSETLNSGQWDPNEYLFGQVWINFDPSTTPTQLQVVLPNGIKATNINAIAWG